ncbi:hypothetical protein [Tenacibaculum aiptasiae]|uniref:hypothetical protein n=1 Tax=Tenacibaculum aiptasiae TaxID=426481 RepID=UPI002331112F|nr:hypothetical protein [Tenacibaculum aiptasiae]
MQNTLKEIEIYLQSKPENLIDIFNYDNHSEKYYRKFSYADLQEKGTTIKEIISQLHYAYNLEAIGVQKYAPNGSSSKKVDYVIKIQRPTEEKMPEHVVHEAGQSVAESQPATQPVSHFQSHTQHQPMYVPGMSPGLGMNAPMGMSMPDAINLYRKADQYDGLLKINEKLEEKLKKKEAEIEVLVIDNRQLKSDLHLADQVKLLALETEKLNKKPFLDPSTINKFLELAPNFIPGSSGTPAGMAAPDIDQGLSEGKKNLIQLIKSDNIDDLHAQDLSYLAVAMKLIPAFREELNQLIEKHNVKEQVK